MTDIIKRFREAYKKAYKGILPDEVLEQGNQWFEHFITQELTAQHKKDIEAGRQEVFDEMKHEQQKMFDGFSHPKDCKECLQSLTKE